MYGGRWNIIPDQEADVSTVMRNCFEFDPGQDILEGALVYGVQRQHIESNELIQDEPKSTQLLVAWHVEHTEGLHVRALLVEHDKEFNLDKDEVRRLYQKYWPLLKAQVNSNRSNWLLNDTTMLATKVDVMNGGYRWDVFVFEGKGDNAERPLWIDTER
jgi:hypothetical protein